jgi:hypothetical protein
MAGCTVFSKINLVKAYHQIPIAEADIPKPAIAKPFGLWEFLFMAFGLRNAAQALQRLCAAGAVFCYTAENSHHRKAQVTPKNPQFQEEKISERRKARSQVTSEKSSKNYISLFGV